jgi:hypothetical protein
MKTGNKVVFYNEEYTYIGSRGTSAIVERDGKEYLFPIKDMRTND